MEVTLPETIRVFIGSSKEALNIAYAVKEVLEGLDKIEARVWKDALFHPGAFAMEELISFTTDFDFAVFIWSGEDRGIVREQEFFLPRDNVILEAGMFYSTIGKDRVFLIASNEPQIKTPSDLLGVYLSFYSVPSDDNFIAAVTTPVRQIANLMIQRGKLFRNLEPSILYHENKFDVPNGDEFWSELLRSAKNRFYLIGSSNQSWIDKSEEYSSELSNAIFRIVKNGGKVRFFSTNEPNIIKSHHYFFKTYFRICLDQEPQESRLDTLSLLEQRFTYATYPHSNYEAVVSDEKIILIPTMNSLNFQDESLILEMQDAKSQKFKNYLADIDRLLRDCQVEDVISTLEVM